MLGGFADHLYDTLGQARQPTEQFAADRLNVLLRQQLAADTMALLRGHGALLTEAAAWGLAVRPDAATATASVSVVVDCGAVVVEDVAVDMARDV